jgi:hypothetical protein
MGEGIAAHFSTTERAQRARTPSVNTFQASLLCFTPVLTESRSPNMLMHVAQSFSLTCMPCMMQLIVTLGMFLVVTGDHCLMRTVSEGLSKLHHLRHLHLRPSINHRHSGSALAGALACLTRLTHLSTSCVDLSGTNALSLTPPQPPPKCVIRS